MPRALAIETSGRAGSIALVEHGQLLDETEFPHGLAHAAGIVAMIDGLCRRHGWTPNDLAELYVSAGPGSFTGLRIGITLAKTMAFSLGLRLVAVPSVRVLAENAPGDARHVLIVLDAKREQVYTARFERVAGEWVERESAHLDRLTDALARAPRPVHLLGEGITAHRQFVPEDPQVIVTPPNRWCARAAAVARVGMAMSAAGAYADPYRLTPIYIRLPEAEEKWQATPPARVTLA